jgi:hypothetical protein
MHPAAQRYLTLPSPQQKAVQLLLCEQALAIWERAMPTPIVYRDKSAGTLQFLESGLPREAILAVKMGKDKYQIAQRFLKPMAGLQSDSIVVPGHVRFAYFAIHNLFASHVLSIEVDPWLVPNQALAAFTEDDVIPRLEAAMASVAKP